jgi:hypothetical protein
MQSPYEETAEAGRQVALYVTELETRRPLTVGEDYLVQKQRADDLTAQQVLKWTGVLENETSTACVLLPPNVMDSPLTTVKEPISETI